MSETPPTTRVRPSDAAAPPTAPRVLGVIVCDFESAAIGTRSRLNERWGERTVIAEVVSRLSRVNGVGEIALLVPHEQSIQAQGLQSLGLRMHIHELTRRPTAINARVAIGRAWNLLAWRGGAGQWTVFDEEYHPAAIAAACAAAFDGQGAEHVLVVHSHGIFLDENITSALVHHHLHKNHEMRVTYTPAAPGLSGMVLQAEIVKEMADKNVLPWQLLAYDPHAPTFDTLIRDACMQVDPALSKIPNRFCVDTARSWAICQGLIGRRFSSTAELCLAGARGVAPGIMDLSRVNDWPREVEVELTAQRLTSPPGYMPGTPEVRLSPNNRSNFPLGIAQGIAAPMPLPAGTVVDPQQWHDQWGAWLAQRPACDDLLLTFGGRGDPLLYGNLGNVLSAATQCEPLSICVQTDLVGGDIDGLLHAISGFCVGVVSVNFYGYTRETYARVAGVDLYPKLMQNMERLAALAGGRGGIPLVVPRLLKVRETIPELEPFFDFWLERCGWAVIDGPTDLAGTAEFRGVVDMAPPKRKPCRRLWDRMLVRADGRGATCDQDVAGKLCSGSIATMSIPEMWTAMHNLRNQHAAGRWAEIDPCKSCREWHRP